MTKERDKTESKMVNEKVPSSDRRPYSPPAIEEEIPIENVAMACSGTEATCKTQFTS